jgi:hypothetical protein
MATARGEGMSNEHLSTETIAVALTCLLLSGCEPAPRADWELAPKRYACTVEQMKRVETETKFCNENTSYFETYCYGTAIMRNCAKKGAK